MRLIILLLAMTLSSYSYSMSLKRYNEYNEEPLTRIVSSVHLTGILMQIMGTGIAHLNTNIEICFPDQVTVGELHGVVNSMIGKLNEENEKLHSKEVDELLIYFIANAAIIKRYKCD